MFYFISKIIRHDKLHEINQLYILIFLFILAVTSIIGYMIYKSYNST